MSCRRRSIGMRPPASARKWASLGKWMTTTQLLILVLELNIGLHSFETREIAEKVLAEFHNITAKIDNVKLLLRFADTKAQKALKQQSNRRRAYRAEEYNYLVGVNGLTPSPTAQRFQRSSAQITPISQQTMDGTNWTPATTISPK
jgi:hypothetical protein